MEIVKVRISHLAQGTGDRPSDAATLTSAAVTARTWIVEGAVGMVEPRAGLPLRLGIVDLDEERIWTFERSPAPVPAADDPPVDELIDSAQAG